MKSLCPALLFLGVIAPAVGGSFADIGLDLELPEGNLVVPGEVARLVLTITNHGPDSAVSVAAGSGFFITPGYRTVEIFPTIETPPCRLNFTDFIPPPPAPGFLSVDIIPVSGQVTTLEAGESVSCVMGLSSFSDSPATVVQPFVAGSVQSDPNPANNEVSLIIFTAPRSIPSAGSLALSIFAALVLLSAARKLHRC